MKVKSLCVIVLLASVCFNNATSLEAAPDCDVEELRERLKSEPWEGTWHSHDDSPHDGITGRHFHRTHRDVGEGGCSISQTIGAPHNPGELYINPDDTDTDDPPGDFSGNQPTNTNKRPNPNEIFTDDSDDSDNEDLEILELSDDSDNEDLEILELSDDPDQSGEPQLLTDDPDLPDVPNVSDDPSQRTTDAPSDPSNIETATRQTPLNSGKFVQPPTTGQPSRQGVVVPTLRLRITEYMVRDWSNHRSGLPQWIEIHNPSPKTVNLKGYIFRYATVKSGKNPYLIHTLILQDHSIPSGGTMILVTRATRDFSGIRANQVYNLSIPGTLKLGWGLWDAQGIGIHYMGRKAFSAVSDPIAPPRQENTRVSYQVYPSETPATEYSYGGGIGSPGYYEQPAPAAPSVPGRKKIGLWGDLKRKSGN